MHDLGPDRAIYRWRRMTAEQRDAVLRHRKQNCRPWHRPHHGYVRRWQDWPWSNAEEYLAAVGADAAESVWKAYPILEYGKGWDAPEM